MKYDLYIKVYRVEVARLDDEGNWRRLLTERTQTEEEAVKKAKAYVASGHRVKIEVVSILDGWQE